MIEIKTLNVTHIAEFERKHLFYGSVVKRCNLWSLHCGYISKGLYSQEWTQPVHVITECRTLYMTAQYQAWSRHALLKSEFMWWLGMLLRGLVSLFKEIGLWSKLGTFLHKDKSFNEGHPDSVCGKEIVQNESIDHSVRRMP